MSIQFDWNDMSANVEFDEDGHIIINAEVEYFDTESYAQYWKEAGLSEDDITPELLSNATSIDELYYECWDHTGDEESEDAFIHLVLNKFTIDDIDLRQETVDKYNAAQIEYFNKLNNKKHNEKV